MAVALTRTVDEYDRGLEGNEPARPRQLGPTPSSGLSPGAHVLITPKSTRAKEGQQGASDFVPSASFVARLSAERGGCSLRSEDHPRNNPASAPALRYVQPCSACLGQRFPTFAPATDNRNADAAPGTAILRAGAGRIRSATRHTPGDKCHGCRIDLRQDTPRTPGRRAAAGSDGAHGLADWRRAALQRVSAGEMAVRCLLEVLKDRG